MVGFRQSCGVRLPRRTLPNLSRNNSPECIKIAKRYVSISITSYLLTFFIFVPLLCPCCAPAVPVVLIFVVITNL